jgi:hypothetical protein
MIQLNLLPDVKLAYVKAQRSRRLVVSVSILVSALAIVLLVLLLSIDGLQKKHLSDLSRDITNETNQLQSKPQISQILTIQNQLESLTALHSSEPAASRLFDSYLNEVTPAPVSINNFTIDFTQQTASITGSADSLSSINTYVDTLKDTTYTSASNTTARSAFSDVVLSSFSLSTATTQDPTQAASYTITLSYDPTIFDITQQNIKLSVPSEVVTRSDVAQPTALFKASSSSSSSSSSNSGGRQ